MKNQLIILVALLCASFSLAQVSPEEKAALLDFYNATGGPNWTSEDDGDMTNDWDFGGPVTSDWQGVMVTNGHVISIDLQQNNLVGYLPNSISDLPYLEELKLIRNMISGVIPQGLISLTELTELWLDRNEFVGQIPENIGNLNKLTQLRLGFNNLTGTIPNSVASLSSLQILVLYENDLGGTLPENLWSMTNLNQLWLNHNQFQGSIPSELSNLENLKLLNLRDNNFHGPFPDTIGTLQSLIAIDLGYNKFSGAIPSAIWSLPELSITYFKNGGFSGTIEVENISANSKLRDIDISNNQITGSIPIAFSDLSNLNSLYFQNNQMSGLIPDLSNAFSLALANNKFQFGDFEGQFPQYNSLTIFEYNPQSKVPTQQNVNANSVQLSVNVSGNQNHYQWFKNGVAINGAPDSSSYSVPGTSTASGAYFCRVTSDIVTGLVIESEPVSVYIAPDGRPRFFTGDNYVYTRTYQTERTTVPNQKFEDDDAYIQDITYFDGLGRTLQQNGVRQAPDEKDLVTHFEYDGYGRMAKEWLPFHDSLGTIGSFKLVDIPAATRTYYQNKYADDFTGLSTPEINAYSEKVFEHSPLNRTKKQGAPGKDWRVDITGDDHGIEFEYETNGTSEVRLFQITFANDGNGGEDTEDPTLVSATNSYYAANELSKTVTKDENHSGTTKNHTTEEFTDKQGQVVLKRTYADIDLNADGDTTDTGEQVVAHDTYYVYDDFGNLTFVLPPKVDTTNGVSETELNELCYQYRYDARNRLVEKKIPGKGWEYIIYNTLDQPIMTQDANQAAKNPKEWLFTKYDAFGRVAYTGKATDNRSRAAVQEDLNSFSENLWVRQSENSNDINGIPVYYNDGAYPTEGGETTTGLTEVLTVNYYDNYDFLSNETTISLPRSVFQKTLVNHSNVQKFKTRGLMTGSKVKVLGTNDWITSVLGYDEKGRIIYISSSNGYLETVDIVQTELDFIGKTIKSKMLHIKGGNTIATIDNFTYDHVGRLVSQTQCIGDENIGDSCEATVSNGILADRQLQGTIDSEQLASNSITVTDAVLVPTAILRLEPGTSGGTGGAEELIVLNEYAGLGQLKTKTVGGTPDSGTIANSNGLQQVDYYYNVRGWLTSINDGATSNGDLFAFKVNYNTVEHGGTPLYNGNIAETGWATASVNNTSNPVSTDYRYLYDAMNRIISATDNTGNYNLSNVTYDKNGNILTLNRKGHTDVGATTFGDMDDLSYAYDSGNKLLSVTDAVNTPALMKGEFKDGNKVGNDYSYDQNGNMTSDLNKGITGIEYNHLNLPEQVDFGNDNIKYVYGADGTKLKRTSSSGTETLYAGNYIYEGSVGNVELQFFDQPEGYVTPDGQGGYDYVYNYVDHLGSVRLSYTDADGNGNIDPANEIIEENNYYPYGLKHKGYNDVVSPYGNSAAKRWKFNGKELDGTFDIDTYDFGARNYYPALGRWFGIDELAEDYSSSSPYAFVGNNPMTNLEIDGRFWIRTVDENGNVTYTAEDGDSAYSLFEQFGEQDGFNADEANFIIEHVFGENRVEDGEEFSNIDPEDSFTLLAEGSEIIEKEGERDIIIVPNDSDAVETDPKEVNMGSFQKDQATLKAEDDRKGLVMLAEMVDPIPKHFRGNGRLSKPLTKVLKGLKLKGRKTSRATFGSKIELRSTQRLKIKANNIKAQEKIRRKKFKKRLKRNARKKKSGR